MILDFANAETAQIWAGHPPLRLPQELAHRARKKLRLLDMAADISELLDDAKNDVTVMRGRRSGQFSIRIAYRWRICFNWSDGDAHHVEIVDFDAE